MILEMPSSRVNRTRLHIFAIIAASVSVVVFLGALRNGFLGWDDTDYVVENPFIRTLSAGPAFTRVVLSNWHPLAMLSYAVDYGLWGLNPAGYHLTNIVLHGLNTYLVALLTLKLMESADRRGFFDGQALIYASFFSALLFALHPLRVESVAWVAERKDVLCGFFYILSVIEYVKYAKRKNGWAVSYALAVVFAALALLSKPMAVSLPLVFLIIDFYPLERFAVENAPVRRIVLEKAPFVALAAADALATLWAQSKAMVPLKTIPFGIRAAVALRAYAFYLYRAVLPVDLAPFYPLPQRPFDGAFAVAALLMAALAALSVVAAAKRVKAVPAAFLYYAVTMLPVIGLVQVGGQAAADRYTYLPLLGVSIVASAAAARLYGRSKATGMAALAAMTLVLSILTIRQVSVWKDSLTLWSREIEIYPGRVALSYVDRGVEFGNAGRYGEAIGDFNEAIRIDPGFMEAYNDRGVTLMRLKSYADAVKDFDIALSRDPGNPDIYQNRGISLLHLGRYGDAVSDLEKAISISPGKGMYYYHLGRAYAAEGDGVKAKECFEKASGLKIKEADGEIRRLEGQAASFHFISSKNPVESTHE